MRFRLKSQYIELCGAFDQEDYQAMLSWFEYCGKVPSIEPLCGEDVNGLLVDEWIKHKATSNAMKGDCDDFREETAYLSELSRQERE